MTTTVHISHHEEAGTFHAQIVVTDPALDRANVRFNPSGLDRVTRIKLLAAALYSELDAIASETVGEHELAYQRAFTAGTLIELGAMSAVAAAIPR